MAAATEAKDPDTQGHILRVAQLSCRLGREMGLTPSRLRVLARAGLLHDVGKIQIPDAILKKPGALNDEEWEIMKRHPLLGHDILRGIGRLEEEIKILVAHHERLDGTGYPFGRAGNQISFETRILSVADFFDALTADRPYRKALAWDVALDITKRAAGSHLDPECVGALFRLIETDPAAMQAALNVQPAPSAATPANLYVPELNPRPVHY
jgi:putative nucleotidyltransferase with HDIG domain